MDAMPVVWRGVRCGVGWSALVGAVLGAVMAFGALLSDVPGGVVATIVTAGDIGLTATAVGAAFGVLPGLVVGVALARSAARTQAHRWAALSGGGAFLLQSAAVGLSSGVVLAVGLAMLGTPTAALLAAVSAKAVREGGTPARR
ncbi:hypothetical protein [Streptacidiphilus monticola]|uniref:Major facilitator superfamily (MFS) profile domain-containing protein n=1 Tax=Streptacidiphilus monticola TaxID=2161674 RepID=A0ABW1G7V5_9ACTN